MARRPGTPTAAAEAEAAAEDEEDAEVAVTTSIGTAVEAAEAGAVEGPGTPAAGADSPEAKPATAAPAPGAGLPAASPSLDFSPPAAAAALPPAVRRAVDSYVARFAPLVQMELDEERRQVEERLRVWPLPRLRSEGLVLVGLRATRRGSYLGKAIVRLTAEEGGELPFHRFTSGTLVTLCRTNPLTERSSEGLVLDRSRWEVRLVMEQPPRGLNEGMWRLDKGVNITTYQRMAQAMQALYKDPDAASSSSRPAPAAEDDGGEGEEEDTGEGDAGEGAQAYGGRGRGGYGRGGRGRGGDRRRRRRRQDEEEEDELPPGSYLADVLLAASPAATAAAAAAAAPLMGPAALQWAAAHIAEPTDPRVEDPQMGLNMSQVRATALAMRHRVVLLQGPPGTGKTTTITRFIHHLKTNMRHSAAILACAQSNVAVDNLLEGLVDLGLRAVRVGQPVKVRESLRDATLDARILAHPGLEAIENMQTQLRDMRARLPSLRGRDRGLGHRDVSLMGRRVREMRSEMMADILKGADVICSTCVGAGGDQLQDLSFPLVVLDEGSQCCEPEALIPLVKGCRHAVLVGDHCQLPPVVQSERAAAGGLGRSLFERLMTAGVPASMLQVQYRMHPLLSCFPSARFYGGRLVDGVTAQQRPPPPLPLPGAGAQAAGSRAGESGAEAEVEAGPLMFVDVPEGREEVSRGGSKSNRAEALVVAGMVRHMLAAGMSPADIGIVTPYIAQVQLLSNLLMPLVPAGGPPLEVSSVDGYQGREKEVMVFSTVRANPSASLGFLEDWRRLNVAITRPRRALILVGNADTLRRGDAAAAAAAVGTSGSGSGSGFGSGQAAGSGSGSGSGLGPGPAVGSGGHWSSYMAWLEGLQGGVVVRGGAAGLSRLGWRLS
ncbi:hypothetical protein PLESTF_000610500 [Pleodorina starrii]|nr:hypothetical protein PLESTF_000610500 [Pleodorina starrii]